LVTLFFYILIRSTSQCKTLKIRNQWHPNPHQPVSPYFKKGLAVEISFRAACGFPAPSSSCSWRTSSDLPTSVLSLHRLRPRPPEIHRKFEIVDKVDALHNDGWQECNVPDDLGNGSFGGVRLEESKENVVLSEKQLRLHLECKPSQIILPDSLQLPALKTLHIDYVYSAASDNGVAEPFSNSKVLCISNSTLSSLAICSFLEVEAYEDALTIPNLSSFTIKGFASHQLSSTCNLSYLGEAYINVSMKRKETEGKSTLKMNKGQRKRGRRDKRDRFSELPDCVLLHIMEFMDTKQAVQTCVLSKRWKNLWKRLTNLAFNTAYFDNVTNFSKFVSQVLSNRDGSVSLLNLDFTRRGLAEPKLLNRVMKYAVLHNVQVLTIFINLNFRPSFEFRPFIFSCQSLMFLRLSISSYDPSLIVLPESLHMPALKSLELESVTFTAGDSGCAEPFSTCNVLNTLALANCALHNDAEFLCISNSNLSSLTIHGAYLAGVYKIMLSTPSLSSLTITDHYNHRFSSTCNLPVLEHVTIDTFCRTYVQTDLYIISWLQVLTNVKIMTLSSSTLEIIRNDLANPVSMAAQPPCFVRLELLKVEMRQDAGISDAEVNRIVEYLLQNSPPARVDVINC
ncbi:F-box/FBD/LRR-repeat protein At1g78750-like, partial [Abrus precatorius]|uniref:F-box/FBD/LRR-repeat protein At1g78750-like n=1 Tax=Abrus precatorius TaxID=3816 RepID=A0A8B8LLK7_ABRPR